MARKKMTVARRPGWWIPWIFVASFVVVAAVNGMFIYFASTSWTGLQTEDAYEKGLSYNATIDAAKSQARMGWTGTVDFAATTERGGRLSLDLVGRDGTPVDGAVIDVLIVRPTREGYDQRVSLAAVGRGRYAADIDLPLRGVWDVKLQARRDNARFGMRERIVLR